LVDIKKEDSVQAEEVIVSPALSQIMFSGENDVALL
jgi:hypothetical protein